MTDDSARVVSAKPAEKNVTVTESDLIYIIPAAALGFWWALMFLISRVSGWSALAEVYQSDGDDDGPKLRRQSLMLMRGRIPASYNNAVTIGADSMSLRLSVMLFFRPFHEPLKIPFSDLVATRRRVLLLDGFELSSTRVDGPKIVVSRKQAEWIAVNAAGALRLPAEAAA